MATPIAAIAMSPYSAIWLLIMICETLISTAPNAEGTPIARTALATLFFMVKYFKEPHSKDCL